VDKIVKALPLILNSGWDQIR